MTRPVFVFLSLIPFIGCGRDSLAPVAGKVFVNNAPLVGNPSCYVIFQPDRDKGNNSPHEPNSPIAADGTYKMTTGARAGVAPGWYRIRVNASEALDPKNPYFTKWLIPEKYNDFQKSGLTVEVTAQPKADAYDLKIQK